MKLKLQIALVLTLAVMPAAAQRSERYEVPLYGNTYYDEVSRANFGFAFGRTKDTSLRLGGDCGLTATSYVYFVSGQSPRITLSAEGKGDVEITVDDAQPTVLKISTKKQKEYKLGTFVRHRDGYMVVRYRLLDATSSVKLHSLIFSGVTKAPVYLKPGSNTYFGLRGPSCHLNYGDGPRGSEVEWATISVTVPEDFDREGSYYMALGFSGGYFGMQNNGRGRRNALFSLWNTEESDNPNTVSESNRVQVIAHGDSVTVRDFGNEGSGKQSFINAGWQPNRTYQFLLHAKHVDSTTVDYSAWFRAADSPDWTYMSTLRRPNTKVLLRGLHSFLENFQPINGNKTRKAYYHNVWIKPIGGEWQPIKRAFLTCDDTGNRGRRLDFGGGVEQGRFFLTNGGYFDRPENIERRFSVGDADLTPPDIELSQFTK